MKKIYFLLTIVLLLFTACGGGSDSPLNNNNTTTASGTAQLGYIQSADVELYELSNPNKVIATTKTSSSINTSNAGSFTFNNIEVEDNKYYLIKVSNGKDIDVNDDGVVDDTYTDLNGSVYTLAKGSDLSSGDVRINALTDMAYQKLKGNLSSLTTSDIDIKLANVAKEYIYDIDGDNIISNKDILKFDPTKHIDKTRKSYRDILDIYVPNLHNNESDEQKLASLMYLDNPRIVIKNGALQEVPFKLEVSIENKPQNTTIKWYLNSVEKLSINEQITNDGIYSILAEIYKGDKLLKTISSQVIATKQVEIASIDVDITKENSVFVTDESNSSLAGTKITVPKGALNQNTKITIKKSSVNTIPNTDGISISDVIVMEPSGLKFDKPVQIRIPYNENIDIENQNIRIARYSDGGKIDYIEALFIDKENHEVVFETEHFTQFELQEDGQVLETTDLELDDIKIITGLNYTDDEWEEILNTNIINENTTIYDLYIKYKNQELIYDFMKNKQYKLAYDEFVNYSKKYKVKDILSSMTKVYNYTKSSYDTYSTISDNLKTLFISKKYYKQIASNMGFIVENSPAGFISMYNNYVFGKIYDIIDIAKEETSLKALKYFYNMKEQQPNITFELFLKAVQDSKDKGRDTYNIYDEDNENLGSLILWDGWLVDENDGDLKAFDFTKQNEYYHSLNALWEFNENFKAYTLEQHKTHLKDIILDIKSALDFDKAKENKYISNFEPIIGFTEYKDSDTITLNPKINLYGYQNSIKFNIYITDKDTHILKEKIKFNCKIDDNVNKINRSCSGDLSFDSNILNNNNLIKLRLYDNDLLYPDYLDKEIFVHLKKITDKKQLKLNNIAINSSEKLNSNGNYEATIEPEFNYDIYNNYTITVKLNGIQVNNNKSIEINKLDFNNTQLSNLTVYITPNNDTFKVYNAQQVYSKPINLKQYIDNIKANQITVNNDKPKLEIIKVNGIDTANDEKTIEVGDTISYKLSGTYDSIIKKELRGECNKETINSDILYTCTYDKEMNKFPYIKVNINNKSKLVLAKKINVINPQNSAPEIVFENDKNEYTYEPNKKIFLKAIISDSDQDSINKKWVAYKNNEKIFLSTNSTAYIYAPINNTTKNITYLFKLTATDSKGASTSKLYSVIIKGQSTDKKLELQYISGGETQADSCSEYSNKSCTYFSIDSSITNFTKTWTFKNSGDTILNNLKFKLIDDSRNGIIVNNIKTNKSIINIGDEVKVSADFYIPKDLADGKYEARWQILNDDFSSIKTPESNGVSNDAHMWFKFELNRGVSNDNKDLKDLIVGKTFYGKWCDGFSTLIFQENGHTKELYDDGKIEYFDYTISGNILTTINDDKKNEHIFKDISSKYIRFDETNGEITTLYFNKNDALNAPANNDCGNNSQEKLVSDFISGHVTFEDKSSVPTDAWIGIVPSRYQNDASGWNRVTCKISTNGNFGNECYINHNEQGIRDAFADNSETFQIVVFKNHVNPNEHDWNGGEDLYKYVGENEKNGNWSNITVKDEDYQDSSNENQNNNNNYDTEVSFLHNGVNYKTTNIIINMDAQSCPQLQVNIKNEGDVIQFTTNFHSKESFDNAFSNNKLIINGSNLSFYLEQGGASQAINDTLSFYVTFTKNSDGSYDIDSTGYFANKYEDGENRVSNIIAKNVPFDTHHGYGDDSCSNDNQHTNFDLSNIGSCTNALTYPNNNEIWISGTSETIKWNTSPCHGINGNGTIDLYVLHDDPSPRDKLQNDSLSLEMQMNWYKIASDLPNNGEYKIDPKILNGNGNAYVILIVYDDNTWDISDSTFILK